MKKRNILIVLIVLIVFIPYIAHAVSTFVVQETEKVKLEPKAIDPDNDALTISYQSPLDKNGEWQTTYGDAGEYSTRIIVSDGFATISEDVTVIVKRKKEQPTIDFYSPQEDNVMIDESQAVDFKIMASDLNNDILAYEWLLNGKKVS